MKVHGDRYDYDLVTDYTNNTSLVKIICPEHGIFEQIAASHLAGSGCPSCAFAGKSNGASAIETVLTAIGIPFCREKKFKGLKGRRSLFFDFCLTTPANTYALIEYDGVQHFEPVGFFGGEKAFKEDQRRDAIKNAYAAKHNIPLLRIPYWEFDNIETIVTDWLRSVGFNF